MKEKKETQFISTPTMVTWKYTDMYLQKKEEEEEEEVSERKGIIPCYFFSFLSNILLLSWFKDIFLNF